jgi:tetratricopeptide (TPR) repeat protein
VTRQVVLAALVAALLSGGLRADYKQAYALYQQGRFDRAIQELKPDLDSNPDWEFGQRLAGLSYLALKNNALAVASLSRAVQLKSTTPSTFLGLAQAYFNMRRYDNTLQALAQGEPLFKQADDRYRAAYLRGTAHYALERYSDAIADFTTAIREKGGNVSDWTVYSQLGIANFSVKQYDDAIQSLTRALALKPGHNATTEFLGKSYFKKGVALLQAKAYDQAIDALRKARESTPRDGYVSYNLAEAYLFQKNYSEAERAYTQALEQLPRSAEVFQRLGLVYEKQKKWDLSLNAYQKANELNPTPGLKEALARIAELKKR